MGDLFAQSSCHQIRPEVSIHRLSGRLPAPFFGLMQWSNVRFGELEKDQLNFDS